MKHLILLVLLASGCIDEMPSVDEFTETKEKEERLIEEAQAAQDAGASSEAPMDAGAPAVEVDAGAPALEVDAGTPAVEVDAGTGSLSIDAGVATSPQCGDGEINGEEACDNGASQNNGTYGGCNSDCTLAAFCGDGDVNGDEACDSATEGNTGGYNGCNSNCTLGAYCGDGVVNIDDDDPDVGEECDDGNDTNFDSCTNDCNSGSVIVYDPLVPFLPTVRGVTFYDGGTLATTFNATFDSKLEAVDYFVYSYEDLSFNINVSEDGEQGLQSRFEASLTDVYSCRGWCRCRFILLDTDAELRCDDMDFTLNTYEFADVQPSQGNGVTLLNGTTYEIKLTYSSEIDGSYAFFRAFEPARTSVPPSYKTGDGSDDRNVSTARTEYGGGTEYVDSYNTSIHLHHRMDVTDDNDQDGILNEEDLCPHAYNPGHGPTDTDSDGFGDICDFGDADGDGVGPLADHCPTGTNQLLSDIDGDGCADLTEDNDDDDDYKLDTIDNCQWIQNWNQSDSDSDGVGDECDNCIDTQNAIQTNTDGDDAGDVCDTDDDNDGVSDMADNCSLHANGGQLNADDDAFGNACDADDDNDLILDVYDPCPLTPGTECSYLTTGIWYVWDNIDPVNDYYVSDTVLAFSSSAEIGMYGIYDPPGCPFGNGNGMTDQQWYVNGVLIRGNNALSGSSSYNFNNPNDYALQSGDVLTNKATWTCNGESRMMYYQTVISDQLSDDYDNDGVLNADDRCPGGTQGEPAFAFQDIDGDGCKNHEDLDDDGDGVLDSSDVCPLDASGSTTTNCNFITEDLLSTVSKDTTEISVYGEGNTCAYSAYVWYVDDVLLEDQIDITLSISNNDQVQVGSTIVFQGTVHELSADRVDCDISLNDGYEYHTVTIVE